MNKLGQASEDPKVVEQIEEEWAEFVDANAYRDDEGQLIWGESLIRSMGETGLATLRYLAKRGHFESARVLKETFLGLPTQPLAVKLQGLSADEIRVMVVQHFQEHGKLTAESAEALTERFKNAALEDAALKALPEHK